MTDPLSILLVEDDAVIRENLAAYLEDEGMEVLPVATGEEALDSIRKELAVDVCIIDMRLPGIDGDQTIRAIRAERPTLPFLIHTGSVGYELPDDLRAEGLAGVQVLFKPIPDMGIVVDVMHQLVPGRKHV